jgi:hypothetical protein
MLKESGNVQGIRKCRRRRNVEEIGKCQRNRERSKEEGNVGRVSATVNEWEECRKKRRNMIEGISEEEEKYRRNKRNIVGIKRNIKAIGKRRRNRRNVE